HGWKLADFHAWFLCDERCRLVLDARRVVRPPCARRAVGAGSRTRVRLCRCADRSRHRRGTFYAGVQSGGTTAATGRAVVGGDPVRRLHALVLDSVRRSEPNGATQTIVAPV